MTKKLLQQLITGEFKVDEERVRAFYRKGLLSFIKVIGIIWLFFMLLSLANYKEVKDMYFLIGSTIAWFAFMAAIWISKSGEGTFEKTKIIIEKDRVVRGGIGLNTVIINYVDIGKIIKRSDGIVLLRKGFWNVFMYYFRYSRSRDPLTHLENIIFIPYLINDFDTIKEYFLSRKYLSS